FMALRLNDIDLVSSLEPSSLTGRDHRVRLQLCCFLCRLLLFFARLGCRLSLRAGLLQALLQDGNEIDYFGWVGRFLWFFLYLCRLVLFFARLCCRLSLRAGLLLFM